MLRELFTKAGLSLIQTRLQKKFPKELFPVRMYAFRPL
jgi:protein N-terminal methyltransferase